MTWRKNSAGVKDGADCYRVVAGVRWPWYSENAAMFKKTGVRHRAAPDGQGTFIHPDDDEAAQAVINRPRGAPVTTRPDRIPHNVQQPPLADAEMGQMWRNGDSMSVIANLAKRRNGLTVTEVRAIVHRVCGLSEMGAGR